MTTGVQLTGPIVPLATAVPAFPVFEDTFGKGGWQSVADITARNAILTSFRKIGMVVVDQSTGIEYQLQGGITNADWHVHGASALSNALYVDQGKSTNGNGSAVSPFNTLTLAIAYLATLTLDEATVYLTPYDYSSEPAITLPTIGKLNFIGMDVKNSTRLPDMSVVGGQAVAFEACFAGTLTDTVGFIAFFFKGADCSGIVGNSSYVYGIGLAMFNALYGQIYGLTGTFTLINFSGYTFTSGSDTIAVETLDLSNEAVFVCAALSGNSFLQLTGGSSLSMSSALTGAGTGTLKLRDSDFGCPQVDNYNDSVFRGAQFTSQTVLNIACSMDVDSYFSLYSPKYANNVQVAEGGRCTEIITSLTAGEPSCRPAIHDNDQSFDMSGQGKLVVPAGVLTADHSCNLGTSVSVDKQWLIFDSFAHEGHTYTINAGGALYVFKNNIDPGVWRATIQVTSAAGNTFALMSVEPMFWNNHP